MNYLQIVNRAIRESSIASISSSGLSTVAGQAGEAADMISWCATAYDEICAKHDTWKFLRSSFTVNTVASTAAYLPTTCTDTNLSAAITMATFAVWMENTFKMYLTADGVATEQRIYPTTDWDAFRDRWQSGTITDAKPSTFAVRPQDSAIVFGAAPDAIYTVRGDYRMTAPVLAVDADTPLFPSRFHMAIVWLAKMKRSAKKEMAGAYDAAQTNYDTVMGDLMRDQLPKLSYGRPLA